MTFSVDSPELLTRGGILKEGEGGRIVGDGEGGEICDGKGGAGVETETGDEVAEVTGVVSEW